MQTSLAAASVVRPPTRARRVTLLALGVCIAALLAALATVMVHATFSAAITPFAPAPADGLIAEGEIVTLADENVPAVARLDGALRTALLQAETDAAAEGLAFEVTSGWRSPQYQQWLLDDAIQLYASETIARQYVATPDRSSHVTGDAVDIVPLDAQLWLIEHGARYGICQTYANERWHFELATQPGGVCPQMKEDAAG
ncbi:MULTISPECIES: M15 family metallopeptidase [unclassified Microbacterium]|uniref:M15 family metallopeptidase n=1 Tax=unclassified Microbacterium TaxID=2609290 RepID=UPI00214C2503|nr:MULTISPECIES: M15 family metallopeptidase [unclassified Microbacterium]MCR2809347.1 M15 family metallopeptidase [Microbacterium sp. zg.B185]WIM20487.1 M15 family metallopeptidase [Microbacterium sp. zg-B185]